MEVFHFKFKFPQLPSASGFFCHNWPTLTLSYFIAFSIAQTTPQLVCMWSVMKSPVKPAWIKWKLGMFSSRSFQDQVIGWFITFNFQNLRTKSYVVTIQMKPLWLNFWKYYLFLWTLQEGECGTLWFCARNVQLRDKTCSRDTPSRCHLRLRFPLFPASTYVIA